MPIDFSKKYNGTLLLGATLKAVVRRVKFLIDQELDPQKRFRKGSIPQAVYLLGSNRPLNPEQEMPEHVPAILEETGAVFSTRSDRDWKKYQQQGLWPKDEIDMMAQALCWMDVEHWRMFSICAASVKVGEKIRPANTAETVKAWLEVAIPRRYLVVSSQPFCENQLMAVRRAVKEAGKEDYTFDVCGPEAPALQLSRWLDNLAKQLWEECQLLETERV